MKTMQVTSPDLLTVREVARRLAISERTVWRWTAEGALPAPVRPRPRSTRWRLQDIERFLEDLARQGEGMPIRAGVSPSP
jgi:excisionase family DNA binding protein